MNTLIKASILLVGLIVQMSHGVLATAQDRRGLSQDQRRPFAEAHQGQLVLVTIKDAPASEEESSVFGGLRQRFTQNNSTDRILQGSYRIQSIELGVDERIIVRAKDENGEERSCEIPYEDLSRHSATVKAMTDKTCKEEGVTQADVDPHTAMLLLLFSDLPNYLNYRVTCDFSEISGRAIGYGVFAQPCSQTAVADCPDPDIQRALFNYQWTPNPQSYPVLASRPTNGPAFPEVAKLWESLGPSVLVLAATAAQESARRRER